MHIYKQKQSIYKVHTRYTYKGHIFYYTLKSVFTLIKSIKINNNNNNNKKLIKII